MSVTPAEGKRKLVHMAVGGFAFLLRVMTWRQAALMAIAAFFFNWYALPRLGGRGLWREPDHGRGYPLGILLYPLAVLALILVFHDELWKAASVWGILALGDGMASLFGLAAGGPRLPWNPRKSWAGLLAFMAFGTLASSVLAAWTLRLPLVSSSWASPRILAVTVPVVLLCAFVESMPTTLDDNFTVPVVGAVALALLSPSEPRLLLDDPQLDDRVFLGLVANGMIAAGAYAASALDVGGAVSAVIIGTAITAGLGTPGLLLMIVFFVLGSAATRRGHARKVARGIAQAKGGARGWRNAWANGGVPAVLAVLAAMTPAELASLFTLGYAAAVATAAADTCSSEIGKAYGSRTVLITSLRAVPPGTEGAVSLEGTLAGAAAAVLVAAMGPVGRLYAWPLVPIVAVAGFLGSVAESILGTVAERRGWMGNDALNVLNTAFGAGIAALLLRVLS
jgi:uncharacterized protein (TIGR00297 family)